MKSIFFTRHSFTEYSYDKNDIDRTLTPEGFDRINDQCKLLNLKSEKIDCIISSSALRAKQTALELKSKLGINTGIIYLDWLYESYTTHDLLELFHSLTDAYQNVMMIAHNPTISYMASNFDHSRKYVFNPCSILKLNFEIDNWTQLEIRLGKNDYYLG